MTAGSVESKLTPSKVDPSERMNDRIPLEIAGSALTTEISAVKGDRIELRITGSTHAIAKGPWLMGDNYWKPDSEHAHSIATRVFGTATYDTKKSRFVALHLLALGEEGRAHFGSECWAASKISIRARCARMRLAFLFAIELASACFILPICVNFRSGSWISVWCWRSSSRIRCS